MTFQSGMKGVGEEAITEATGNEMQTTYQLGILPSSLRFPGSVQDDIFQGGADPELGFDL